MGKLTGLVTLVVLMLGCSVPVDVRLVSEVAGDLQAAPRVNGCSADEGLTFRADGSIETGITACAICRRYEDAYYARAAELGCDAAYPLDGCPIDDGASDCLLYTVESDLDWIATLETCDALVHVTGQIEEYGGHLCGAACTWTDPYAAPVTSSASQNAPRAISGGWDHDSCVAAAALPYECRGSYPACWCPNVPECDRCAS